MPKVAGPFQLLTSCRNEQPRFEPREQWPIDSPCAKPQVEVRGSPGDSIVLKIDGYEGRRHLPIIQTRLAA